MTRSAPVVLSLATVDHVTAVTVPATPANQSDRRLLITAMARSPLS